MTKTALQCPVCGKAVDLVGSSPEFGSGLSPLFWGDFPALSGSAPNFFHGKAFNSRGLGVYHPRKRRGLCEQLDETGERAMIHFTVDYNQKAYNYYSGGAKAVFYGGRVRRGRVWRKSE